MNPTPTEVATEWIHGSQERALDIVAERNCVFVADCVLVMSRAGWQESEIASFVRAASEAI